MFILEYRLDKIHHKNVSFKYFQEKILIKNKRGILMCITLAIFHFIYFLKYFYSFLVFIMNF